MPKYNSRFKLTPMPATNRWRKIYRGQSCYVGIGHCSSKTNREGYAVAIEEWRKLKDRLDSPAPDELKIAELVQDLKDNPAGEVLTPGDPIINRLKIILDAHEVYGRYVEHYLAHKPSTITSKPYRVCNQEKFDNAIRWLGKQLGIE